MDVFDLVVVEVLFVDAVKSSDVGVSFVLESLHVEGGGFFDLEAVCSCFMESLGDGRSVPCDFFRYTATARLGTFLSQYRSNTYPTLTHVPPSLLLSTAIVFAPHCPLALLAQARPPLPPPITRKSHSLLIGAMIAEETENWREKAASLGTAEAGTL